MDTEVLKFLKQCNFTLENANQLNGLLIPREILLSHKVYENIKPKILEFKKRFSSSSLTSLHKNAEKEQKWPLLNLVRQTLRICNYQMNPVRRSAGYDDNGKKKYKRYFFITKIKSKTDISNNLVSQDSLTI